MNKYLSIGLILFFSSIVFSIPHAPTEAAAPGFLGNLVPQCGQTIQGGKLVNPCESCHVTQLAQNLVNFFVYIAAIVATIMFVYAGFLYLTSGANPQQINQAHNVFATVFVGFILVLVAWLFVDLVMKTFLDERYTKKYFPWNKIDCGIKTTPVAPVGTTPGTGPGTPTLSDPRTQAIKEEAYFQGHGYECVEHNGSNNVCTRYKKTGSEDTLSCKDQGFDPSLGTCKTWISDQEPGKEFTPQIVTPDSTPGRFVPAKISQASASCLKEGNYCVVKPELARALEDFQRDLGTLITITSAASPEGRFPGGQHVSACHDSNKPEGGTCVDINVPQGKDHQSVVAAAERAGLRAVLEVPSSQGCPSGSPAGSCITLPECSSGARPCLTGPHYSIYKK